MSRSRFHVAIVLTGCLLPDLSLLAGPPAPRELVVHAASFYETADGAEGTTHPVLLRLEPSNLGILQVGLFETSAGAVGPQWRAASWMAALVASSIADEDLRAWRISYTLGGLVDGPSAGALTTCGLLALFRGESLPEDVSMTGTIHPDGTIGPVGGIPQKILGAARNGKRRFALPLGQRRDIDLSTGNEVDCIELGRQNGIEVAEVGDLREAYAFLTGTHLPFTPPVAAEAPLPEPLRAALRTACQPWLARCAAANAIVQGAAQHESNPFIQDFRQLGLRLAQAGQAELDLGHEPAAYNRFWFAAINTELAAGGVLGLRTLLGQGPPALETLARASIEEARRNLEMPRLAFQKLSPLTVLDAGIVTGIGANLAASMAYLAEAERLLHEPGTDPIAAAFRAIACAAVSRALTGVAIDTRLFMGLGGPALPSDDAALDSTLR